MSRAVVLQLLLLIYLIFQSTVFVSCTKSDEGIVQKFMELRKAGNSEAAYDLLTETTKNTFKRHEFDNYCYIYRVIDFEIEPVQNGYFGVVYDFYDKRFNKESGELYTFYITKNRESLKVENGRIVFPHTGFIIIRKEVEDKNIEQVEEIINKMRRIDPENPEVNETAENLGFSSKSPHEE
jgi:hypothetical protein